MDTRRWATGPQAIIGAAAALSGVLLGCCYPPVDCGWLAWVALAPLGLALTSQRLERGAWCGVLVGALAYHLMGLDWLRTAYSDGAPLGPYAPGWAFAGLLAAVIYLVVFAASRGVVLRCRLPLCIGLPMFWGTLETVRRLVLDGFGEAATPWLRLGVTQVDRSSIVQVADLGGEGLIGLLVASANGLVLDLLPRVFGNGPSAPVSGWRWAAPFGAAAALAAALAYGEARQNQVPSALGPVVQLVGKHEALSDPCTFEPSADLVVWPELSPSARLFTSDAPRAAEPRGVTATRDRFVQAAAARDAALLVGSERIDYRQGQPRRYNSLVLASADSDELQYWDKRRLVPFAEHSGAVGWLALPSRGHYDRGALHPPLTLESRDRVYRVGCSICYEGAFTEHARGVMRSGPIDFFVQSGSETADRRGVLPTQLLRMAQLRAIETRRPIIRNAHGGRSGVIDASGNFAPTADPVVDRVVLTAPLPLDDRPSLYLAWGDVLTPMTTITCLVGWGLCMFRKNGQGERIESVAGGSQRRGVTRRRRGFSLMELLAVVTILGVIAAVILPRVTGSTVTAKEKVDDHNRGVINSAVERHFMLEGSWPALDLSDIGANPDYFPEGLPTNPVTGAAYRLDAVTHRVIDTGGGGGGGK